jgi:hypothetical protein
MPESDSYSAAARRDEGLRRVSRLTWRAALAGAAGSALIAVAFGHHAQAQATTRGGPGILVPGQPPKPAAGPSQVTSGAS